MTKKRIAREFWAKDQESTNQELPFNCCQSIATTQRCVHISIVVSNKWIFLSFWFVTNVRKMLMLLLACCCFLLVYPFNSPLFSHFRKSVKHDFPNASPPKNFRFSVCCSKYYLRKVSRSNRDEYVVRLRAVYLCIIRETQRTYK